MDSILGHRGCRAEDGVRDMTILSDINELSVNTNLRTRYKRDEIYTYTGTILIAVNPYKELDIYNQEYVLKYRNKKLIDEDPHIFALAESSFTAIRKSEKNQSCVISGESGAGKTETTKFLLQYLCNVTPGVSTWIEQQILEANTILEAFGNAKTIKNDNSSRFGKFMQVCFDNRWFIKGCLMQDYLLEQSRITFQGKGERNYHIFYQLIAASEKNKEMKEALQLQSAENFQYLSQSECANITGVDDLHKFEALRIAFNVFHISSETCDSIFKVLSAILWIGNLQFADLDGEKCELCPDDLKIIDVVSKLLFISKELLVETVLQRQINIRGNITHIPFKIDEAKENRHAMAKALYSRTFAWLVDHINKCTNPGQDQKRFLGILDIFGFENFEINSFEQLCINYTNEKLHKFFNHYVFALEQETYRQEEIKFNHVTFTDNTECLELLEKPPRCILKLLSEECRIPKGSDKSYLVKLHGEFSSHPCYVKGDDRRNWEVEFGVRHYAGCVIYRVSGFVDKNRDAQQDVFFDLMTKSECAFVSDLTRFQDLLGCTIARMGSVPSTISRGSTKGKPTVSDAFRNQLQALVDVLSASNPWYVRCIKPNQNKTPDSYDDDLVLDQLRYLGMNDIIRIRREGYPVHFTIEDFVSRYYCLCDRRTFKSFKLHAGELMAVFKLFHKDWQIGKNKVFMRQKIFETLEENRTIMVESASIMIQRNIRMFCKRSEYRRQRRAAIVIQNWYCSMRTRRWFLKRRRAVILIQAFVRGMFAREVANALRQMKKFDEEEKKRELMEKEKMKLQEEHDNQSTLLSAEKEFAKELASFNGVLQEVTSRRAETKINGSDNKNNVSDETDVDLDSIFEFLSKVHSEKHPLDDTLSNMDNLIEQVDEEIIALNKRNGEESRSHSIPPSPPNMNDVEDLTNQSTVVENGRSSHHEIHNGIENAPLPPSENGHTNGSHYPEVVSYPNKEPMQYPEPVITYPNKEPIYETIPITAAYKNQSSWEHNYISGPPPEDPPPAPPSAQIPPVQNISNKFGQKCASAENKTHSGERDYLGLKNKENFLQGDRRKLRIEKKLNEFESMDLEQKMKDANLDVNFFDFAEKHFNKHEKSSEGSLMASIKRKSPSNVIEYLPTQELLCYTQSTTIPTSHLRLNDPENIAIACTIFKEICKYIRGDTKPEQETFVIQSVVEHGIEREELRNEIFVQCMRLATDNPNSAALEKVWLLLCLCVVAFQPSKLLYKYFYHFIQNHAKNDSSISQYAKWCVENCKNHNGIARKLPPSQVEIAAMKKLGTIVCRLFFMDGRTKAIDVHPRDSAGDAISKLSERLGLLNVDGWSIYVVGASGEKHVKSHEYLYDIISSWEKKSKNFDSLSKKSGGIQHTIASVENRFVFRRRLFKHPREIPSDPIEVNLLYAQAVCSVVIADEYPINEKVALQLAGLQAQVSLGDPQVAKCEFYSDVNSYLPARLVRTRKIVDWIPILSQAHQQYGTGKTDILAKVWYLTCVMQFPLYGTTMFKVSYRGYWSHGSSLILGVNCDGISIIKPDDKSILCQYRFCEIESLFLDPSDNFITINLLRTLPEAHKCFVFETNEKEEIGFLITSYCPNLSSWIRESESGRKAKAITSEDRLRLYYNIVHTRRQLIDSDLLRKPIDQGPNFIVSTLRRLNNKKLDRFRVDVGETPQKYKGFHHTFWAFSRIPLTQPILKIDDPDIEAQAFQISQIIFSYSGLNPSEICVSSNEEQLAVTQNLLEQCMKQHTLLNETYLQLIKQTSEHPDANSRVNLRHWSLLTLFCSVIPPTDKLIRKYLRAHLQRCSVDYVTEEGKYARYAEKCLLKALNNRRRQWPPSKQEILCTTNRRPIYARFHFMDGQFYSVEFDPPANTSDVVEIIKRKIGLKEEARGYAIYEMLGTTERCLCKEEVLSDVMSRWERYKHSMQQKVNMQSHHIFLFKKHLLLESWIDLMDPVEKELLYFQVLYTLRADKFPVTHTEAVMLCALRAQIELGNYLEPGMDYTEVIEHTLSPRLLTAVTHDGVAMQHQSLFNMSSQSAKESFLTLIKSFPLHRATIFDVTQSFTSNWPKVLWLAIDESGVHLLEHRSRNVLCTYEYTYILNYSASLTAFMLITGSKKKQSKVILNTSQAFMILTLIKDYSEVVLNQETSTSNDRTIRPEYFFEELLGRPANIGTKKEAHDMASAEMTNKSRVLSAQTIKLRKLSDRSVTAIIKPV